MEDEMGAWGSGPFENDDAADWAWELEEASDHGVLRDAFQAALDETGYLDVREGANAVAAAAVVATALDGDAKGLSEEVVAYIGRTGRPDADTVDLALRALERVGRDGELAELWDETDDPSWRAGMASLHDRLRG
jgi:hypothetical protein